MQEPETASLSASKYLEQYLESISTLPLEVRRNFNLLREMDKKANDTLQEIDRKVDEFAKAAKIMRSEDKKNHAKEIQELYNKVRGYGDDKVHLAIQTYELVDKHIRRLDSDLSRFETEVKEKNAIKVKNPSDAPKQRGRKKNAGRDKKKQVVSSEDDESPSKAGKKKKKVLSKLAALAISSKTLSAQQASDVTTTSVLKTPHATDAIDMPVDPNEPTYCLCNQVSYGEMIGCDNPDCSIEWFHFACVNLSTKPKGKWYCPRCTTDRKKK